MTGFALFLETLCEQSGIVITDKIFFWWGASLGFVQYT